MSLSINKVTSTCTRRRNGGLMTTDQKQITSYCKIFLQVLYQYGAVLA